jgi:ABC-2 type transport system permease protein
MSILGPLLFAGLMLAPAVISQMDDTEVKVIAVSDSTHLFHNYFPETEYMKFTYLPNANIEAHKKDFWEKDYYAVLDINTTIINPLHSENQRHTIHLYSDKAPSLSVQTHISNAMEKYLEKEKLKTYGIDENILRVIKTNIDVDAVKITKDGTEKKSNFTLSMILGYVMALLIYMVIFISGTQVMRGVLEEKTSRIVEVMISSVKPFELMAGKIIGVGLVVLSQFGIWIVLTMVLYSTVGPMFLPDVSAMGAQQEQIQTLTEATGGMQAEMPAAEMAEVQDGFVNEMLTAVQTINFTGIIVAFILFFLGGYFLYGSLFAAVGSAVDSEADTQQFMLPLTIPMILAIIIMSNVIQNPESPLAFWASIIPFTSPVIMMARIPFGVPIPQIILSVVVLYATIVFFIWISARIYRTGILMYGKKVNWKEIWKWIRYSG